jgi:hypothetical protein
MHPNQNAHLQPIDLGLGTLAISPTQARVRLPFGAPLPRVCKWTAIVPSSKCSQFIENTAIRYGWWIFRQERHDISGQLRNVVAKCHTEM